MIHRATPLLSALLMLATPAVAQDAADRIFHGGPVLTMEDDRPRAEAVAVRDGDILAVGTEAEVMRHRGPETDMVDLAVRALIPGFVDAHGHVFMIGVQALSANMLPAPDGEVNDIAAMQAVLADWAETNPGRVDRAGLSSVSATTTRRSPNSATPPATSSTPSRPSCRGS